jgi:hypothetical protein
MTTALEIVIDKNKRNLEEEITRVEDYRVLRKMNKSLINDNL